MPRQTESFSPSDTLSLDNRRSFGRYQLPVSLLAEARWNGRVLPLASAPEQENISASGASLVLAKGPLPPVDAPVDVSFPLMGRPFQPSRTIALCHGHVVRHGPNNRVALEFDQVEFVREERASGIPDSMFATA